jgi:hypothetical protein
MVRHTRVIHVNSRPSSGALAVSADGSSFTVKWRDPIKLPQQSNATISTLHAEFWNSFQNVSAAATLWLSDDATDQKIPIVFAPGSYGLDQINNTLQLQLAAQSSATQGTGQISFSGEEASGRLALVFPTDSSWRVWMGDPSFTALRDLMGFTAAQNYLPGPTGTTFNDIKGKAYLAANRATLNQVSEIIVHSDIVQSANTTLNGRTNQALAAITPNVAIGSQRLWQPAVPIEIDVPGLEGAAVSQAHFWLTTQDGNTRVNTGGEDWGTTLLLSWDE